MKRIFILMFFNILLVPTLYAQELSNTPVKIDTDSYKGNLATVKEYDLPESGAIGYDKVVFSPHKTKKLYIKSTDPSVVPYNESKTTITVMTEDGPVSIVEVKAYKSFNVEWINEETIHIESWPGRCIQIDEIIDVTNNTRIYSSAFNHCNEE